MTKGVFFLSFATIAAGAGTYETELLRGIDIYNFRSKCWGKSNVDKYAVDMENAKRECMQMEPAFDFPGHGDGPLRGSPALDCRRTSTTPPPSLLLSCRTLCLKRRSSLKGSSGTSTVTSSS